jgi:hypothetical protein
MVDCLNHLANKINSLLILIAIDLYKLPLTKDYEFNNCEFNKMNFEKGVWGMVSLTRGYCPAPAFPTIPQRIPKPV